tara:strand:- start:47 stop:793 length:747 start_codon:yes stop_codon:yes gene_type:complete
MKKKLQTINYTNGDKYYGEISKDKKHGFGTYTWKDGSVYFGNWENNKKHGKGTFIDASGEELSAVWSKGKFKSQTYRIADESIDLNYLQKHLKLKNFISYLNKNTQKWGNDPAIYYDFLKACATERNNEDVLFHEINENRKLYGKFEKEFSSGKFLPMISDNFKLIKINFVEDIFDKYEEKREYFVHQVISSKINKMYYVLIYQGYDYTNDGYYSHKKFKDKKKALEYIKDRKNKIWKKYVADQGKYD